MELEAPIGGDIMVVEQKKDKNKPCKGGIMLKHYQQRCFIILN